MTSSILEAAPSAEKVTIRGGKLIVDLADGRTLIVPLEWYPRLLLCFPEGASKLADSRRR